MGPWGGHKQHSPEREASKHFLARHAPHRQPLLPLVLGPGLSAIMSSRASTVASFWARFSEKSRLCSWTLWAPGPWQIQPACLTEQAAPLVMSLLFSVGVCLSWLHPALPGTPPSLSPSVSTLCCWIKARVPYPPTHTRSHTRARNTCPFLGSSRKRACVLTLPASRPVGGKTGREVVGLRCHWDGGFQTSAERGSPSRARAFPLSGFPAVRRPHRESLGPG